MTSSLKFLLNLTMTQAIISKRFDARLSVHSISLNDFMILFHLDIAPGQKLRRIDLAEMVGLSASGVTRKLQPLEKIGLVRRESNKRDARVSFVKLTESGMRVLKESFASAELAASELFPLEEEPELKKTNQLLMGLGGRIK